VALLAVAVLGACTDQDEPGIASAGDDPTSPTTTAADPHMQELEFVACMRDQGIADMPDPVPGDTTGRSAVRYALDVMGKGSDPVFQSALDECLALLPEPPAPDPQTPDELEAAREFADCMREHGLDEFPDPQGDNPRFVFVTGVDSSSSMPAVSIVGERIVVNIDDPVASVAWEACQPLFPSSVDSWTVG
jgi:hypothetical protein